jgi:hypothetical protein
LAAFFVVQRIRRVAYAEISVTADDIAVGKFEFDQDRYFLIVGERRSRAPDATQKPHEKMRWVTRTLSARSAGGD